MLGPRRAVPLGSERREGTREERRRRRCGTARRQALGGVEGALEGSERLVLLACPEQRVMRKECRRRVIRGLRVLFSDEKPVRMERISDEQWMSEGSLLGTMSYLPPHHGPDARQPRDPRPPGLGVTQAACDRTLRGICRAGASATKSPLTRDVESW